MRNLKEFTIDIVRKPPVLFPLVGLFHVLWLSWTIWDDRMEPFDVAWLQVAWLVAFTFFWIAAADLRKWAAIGYFIITLLDVLLYIAARNHKIDQAFISNMFLLDCLFSFFLLVYYKRFR